MTSSPLSSSSSSSPLAATRRKSLMGSPNARRTRSGSAIYRTFVLDGLDLALEEDDFDCDTIEFFNESGLSTRSSKSMLKKRSSRRQQNRQSSISSSVVLNGLDLSVPEEEIVFEQEDDDVVRFSSSGRSSINRTTSEKNAALAAASQVPLNRDGLQNKTKEKTAIVDKNAESNERPAALDKTRTALSTRDDAESATKTTPIQNASVLDSELTSAASNKTSKRGDTYHLDDNQSEQQQRDPKFQKLVKLLLAGGCFFLILDIVLAILLVAR